jgi:hypothetical protein
MWGVNLYTGGHFDLYVADYYDYKVRLLSLCCSVLSGPHLTAHATILAA